MEKYPGVVKSVQKWEEENGGIEEKGDAEEGQILRTGKVGKYGDFAVIQQFKRSFPWHRAEKEEIIISIQTQPGLSAQEKQYEKAIFGQLKVQGENARNLSKKGGPQHEQLNRRSLWEIWAVYGQPILIAVEIV